VSSFIQNPRKALRFPLQCGAVVHGAEGPAFYSTVDVSVLGCRLAAARRLPVGERLFLRLTEPHSGRDLGVGGTVVWASQDAPGHVGVRFDEGGQPQVARWVDGIAGDRLELLHHERVPDRLGLTSRLYVSPVPAAPPALGDEEVAVLRLVCRQRTVGDLRRQLGADWSRAQRALFALLTRGVVTLDEAEAGDPRGWLERLEAPGPAARGGAAGRPR
jgi:hypothetical protein